MGIRTRNACLVLACVTTLWCALGCAGAEMGGAYYSALGDSGDDLPPNKHSGDSGRGVGSVGLDEDGELFEVAYRFIHQLTETRKSLAELKQVLGFLDDDLREKSEVLGERYAKGRGLWAVLRAAVGGGGFEGPSGEAATAATAAKALKKRMCRVNLGGHCQTENAASLASQMHFLSSGLSPGKRRRRHVSVDTAAAASDARTPGDGGAMRVQNSAGNKED